MPTKPYLLQLALLLPCLISATKASQSKPVELSKKPYNCVYCESSLTDDDVARLFKALKTKDRICRIDLSDQTEITEKAIQTIVILPNLRSVFYFNLSGTNVQTIKTLQAILDSDYIGSWRGPRQISASFSISSSEVTVELDKKGYEFIKKQLKNNPIDISYHEEYDPKKMKVCSITKLYRFNFRIKYRTKKPTIGMKWVMPIYW